MATKQHGRAGGPPPARNDKESQPASAGGETGNQSIEEKTVRENIQQMGQAAQRWQPFDGIAVTGEAVRRVAPEVAEFLIEITTSAPTAAHALRENQARTRHVAQAVSHLGVQQADIQTVSLNLFNMYSPVMPGFPQLGPQVPPQLGTVGFAPPIPNPQSPQEVAFSPFDLQYGSYYARNTMRVNVRDVARVGEVLDAAAKSGATILGAFTLRVADEAGARRSALEAAGRDARSKAEALAVAAGKQLGDPVAIAEEIVATDGTYMALRAAMPFAFGAGAPQSAGELEYYARVSARFAVA